MYIVYAYTHNSVPCGNQIQNAIININCVSFVGVRVLRVIKIYYIVFKIIIVV